jgi:hypothetical protein
MFEYLSPYLNILVTGPQRSGTRITAKMIAHDLRYAFIDETRINVGSESSLIRIIDTLSHLVIQCPALCHRMVDLSRDNIAIVIVNRPIDQILRSQDRIEWEFNKEELSKYGLTEGVASIAKYDYWDNFQKRRIHHPFEVEYEGLRGHPLWIDPELRGNFRWDQTVLEDGPM